MIEKEPEIYDISLASSIKAAASNPVYFTPASYINGNGEEEVLIDGSYIADNPSMYAFLHATYLNPEMKIRVLSVGVGSEKADTLDIGHVNTLTWAGMLDELINSIEVMTHHFFTAQLSADYVRIETTEAPDMAGTDASSV